jgi:hypothetical protein
MNKHYRDSGRADNQGKADKRGAAQRDAQMESKTGPAREFDGQMQTRRIW